MKASTTVLLVIAFHSFVSVITPLAVLTHSFSSTPTLLVAIGVAHSVHIFSEFGLRFRTLGNRRSALVETIDLASIGAIALGISVDDSIHLMARFCRGFSVHAVARAFVETL